MTRHLYPLSDVAGFRRRNNANWRAITDFWLDAPLAHVHHVGASLCARVLQATTQPVQTILDMGCGNAWLLRGLREAGWRGRYTGVDNNERLIVALRARYAEDADAVFECRDVELGEAFGRAPVNVVVNAFNFFELPDLARGFAWAAGHMTTGGALVVATIDPLAQILAISTSAEELAEALSEWQAAGEILAYDKTIDVEGGVNSQTYSGILYSLADFVAAAKHRGLRLEDIEEVRKTARMPPQVYELLTFRRPA